MADYPSSGGGKIRLRRAAASRKPYSRASSQRKSLFSRVTDSFRTLLIPITPKWLQNRSSNEQATGSPQPEEQDTVDDNQPSTSSNHGETHNRTNNNYKKSSPLARPPLSAKRSMVSTSSLQYFVTPPDTPPVELNKQDANPGVTGGKQDLLKHLSMSSKRAKKEMDQSPVGSDSSFLRQELKLLSANDNASIASSSGCSSSMQVGQRTNTSAENEGLQKPFWSSSMESLASSKTTSSQQQITMSSHKRPRFNPAIFGMPSARNDSDGRNSSFYNGPVQFGGANASVRSPYFATPYKIPSVTKVKVRHVNHQRTSAHSSFTSSRGSSKSPSEETSAAGMSSTAKKILQTLEKMSTPLNDARKIPMTRTPSSYMADRQKRRTIGSSSLLNNSLQAPPTVGLSSPSTARLRRRSHMPLNNSLLVRKAKERREEESIIEPVPSTSLIVPDSKLISARGLPAPIASMTSSASVQKTNTNVGFGSETYSGGGGGKMKSQRRSAPHYSATQDEVEEEAHELPNVALPLTSNLPSFNFGKSLMTSTPTVRAPEKKKFTGSKQPEFSFASPLVKTTITDQAQSSTSTPKFQFSSPPNKGTSVSDDQETPRAGSSATNFTTGSKTGSPSLVFAPDPKIISAVKKNNRRSSPLAAPENQGGFRPTESLKIGGVMDILGTKTKDTSKTFNQESKLAPLTQIKSGWSCDVCMLQNDNDAKNCVACTTPKPGISSTKPFSESLKTSNKGGWDCDTCLLQNDAGDEKCVACETPRPGSTIVPKPKPMSGGLLDTMKVQTNMSYSFGIPAKKEVKNTEKEDLKSSEKPINTFGSNFKPPTGSWGCTVCLVQNDSKSTKCDACQTPKPGSTVQKSGINSNFGFSAADKSSEFKFGIPSKSYAKETSKSSDWGDLMKKPSSSTWECEVCMVPNPDERKTCEACESPKPGTKKEFSGVSFKFSAGPPGAYSFGVQNTKTATTETNTPPRAEERAVTLTSDLSKATSTTTIPAPVADTTKKPTFNFGVPPSAASNTPPVSVPAFGSQSKNIEPPSYSFAVKSNTPEPENKSVKESAPVGGLFSFGAPKKEEQKQEATKPPMFGASKSAGFGFGNQTSSAAITPSNAAATSSVNTNPLLGGTTTSQVSSTPFGSNIKPQQPIAGIGTFGGFKTEPKVSKPEEQKVAASLPAFQFGASKPAAAGAFQFSGGTSKSSNETTANTNSQFAFGAKPEQTKPTLNVFGSSQPAVAENKPAQFAGFGTQANEAPKTTFGGFNFSASKPATTQPAGGVFGSQPAKSSPFGGPSSEPSPFGNPTPTASGFGAPSASSGGVFGAAKPAFGAGSSNTNTPAFGGMSSAPAFGAAAPSETNTGIPKPSFAFGSNSNNDQTPQKGPGFQFGAGNAQQSSGSNVGFNFGATAANKPPPAFNANSGGGFQFGTPTTGQSNGLFQFGAGSKPEQTSENKPGFAFGGSTNGGPAQTQPASSGFNFGGAATNTSGFAFGGPQPVTPQQGFGGANGSTPNVNPFSATPSTTPAQRGGRPMRQARRRLKK